MRSFVAAAGLGAVALLASVGPALAAAPDTTITSGPSGPWASRTATFTFVSSRTNSKFKCKIDAKSWVLCTSPKTYSNLQDGPHTFKVKAKNGTAVDKTPATRAFTVDVTAPTIAITSNPTDPAGKNASFQFTVSDGAIQCRLDTGPFASCSSATTQAYSNLADGSHTFTVTATDPAGNMGSDSYAWSVDATGPTITFDSAPPATWPVNYYDFTWHADEAATYECKLNAGSYGPCTSPWTVANATYGASNTILVRGTDQFGNVGGAANATWAPSGGLVLHYPFEQGSLLNTSPLAQRPGYGPTGSGASSVVGGWAGTALTLAGPSSTVVTFPGSARVLSSSPGGQYPFIGMWVRPHDHDNLGAVLFANTNAPVDPYGIGPTHGLRVSIGPGATSTTAQLAFQLWTSAQLQPYENPNSSLTIPMDKWSYVAVQGNGLTHGTSLLVNGTVIQTLAPTSDWGFEAGAGDLQIGGGVNVDIDDLRVFNSTQSSVCTAIMRGYVAVSQCVAGPAAELDFEHGGLIQDGFMTLTANAADGVYYNDKTGKGFQLNSGSLTLTGFSSQATTPGHTVTLWVRGDSPATTLLDATNGCPGVNTCGLRISWNANRQFSVLAQTRVSGTTYGGQTAPLPVASLSSSASHNIVVAEQRSNSTTTASLRVYVDGVLAATITVGTGDVFSFVPDSFTLTDTANAAIDEFELWPMDLSANAGMMCENGFDGQWDPVTASCSLTSN